MLHRKQKICWEFTGKSPNGKVVKSLYLKIAYMWTRPEGAYTLSPIFLYFWVGGIFPLKKYFQRNSMEYFWATAFHKIHLVFGAARKLIWFFWPNDMSFAIWWKFFNCLAANDIRIICRTLCCENIPWNIPKYLNFNPHTKIKIFLQKYRNIEI